MDRRHFLQFAGLAAAASLVRWRFTGDAAAAGNDNDYDVVVIGAGLGGLSCAALLAKSGFKTLLLEQHYRLGGYATSFPRRAGEDRSFSCEVSLHASALHTATAKALLTEVGVWDTLSLAPHKHAWSSRFPGLAFDIPNKAGLDGFERQLAAAFPGEAAGLGRHFARWRAIMGELDELDATGAGTDNFPAAYPNLWAIRDKSIGQVLEEAGIGDPRVRAILTQSCNYYGLPPSRLSAFFYLGPTGQYLQSGGYYLKGTSQSLSDALGAAIGAAGGTVRTRTAVTAVLMENGRAVGVKTADGRTFKARAVVANACAPELFGNLLPAGTVPQKTQARLDGFTPSPGSCVVWLGLDRDITDRFPDPEVAYYPTLDFEANYAASMAGDFEKCSFSLMAYDNLVPGFSPPGCSTLSLVCLSGYEPWKRFEADYLAGRKEAYEREKQRVADLLVSRAEALALPGLSQMIVMRDAATPLTNLRFTRNAYGSIYGYAPSVDNAFLSRFPNTTAIPGLYLASAWGSPGGGYTGALLGGKQAFKDVATALAG